MQSLKLVFSLAGIIIIIVGAYYVTYYIGVKASGRSRGRIRNRNIALLDRFSISKDKSFCLIEIAGKIYVVGVTNQSITLLDTLSAEEYARVAEKNNAEAWSAASAIQPGGGFFNRFIYYMAEGIKNRRGRGNSTETNRETFADSMRSAREKKDE